MMATYKFVGNGEGVPGLPHVISDDEAAALGVSEILKDAIENGSYVVDPPAARAASPQTKNTFGGKDVKKKESE